MVMHCPNCGVETSKTASYCAACGNKLVNESRDTSSPAPQPGFSSRINDPAFARYVKNANRWSGIFSTVLAAVAVIGFYIAGEVGTEMDNPESLYIGLGIGGMFLAIAFFQIMGRRRSKTWDGTVKDKKIKEKTRRVQYGDDISYEDYLEYSVIVVSDSGKKHVIRHENSDVCYNYYKIGDRVRHHGGLNSYEKYDKTGDLIIFCNACGTLCDINDDYCSRCKCPLLK